MGISQRSVWQTLPLYSKERMIAFIKRTRRLNQALVGPIPSLMAFYEKCFVLTLVLF